MMIAMVLISVAVALIGVGVAVYREHQLPESISSMVYALGRPWRWLWTVWLWAVAFCLGIPMMEALVEESKFLSFLMLVALAFVGAMPLVEEETRPWHYTLAFVAAVLGQVCVAFLCPWALLLWLLPAVCVWALLRNLIYNDERKKWYSNKGVFFAELTCYASMVLGCLA